MCVLASLTLIAPISSGGSLRRCCRLIPKQAVVLGPRAICVSNFLNVSEAHAHPFSRR